MKINSEELKNEQSDKMEIKLSWSERIQVVIHTQLCQGLHWGH